MVGGKKQVFLGCPVHLIWEPHYTFVQPQAFLYSVCDCALISRTLDPACSPLSWNSMGQISQNSG